jgi:hypothetical protein
MSDLLFGLKSEMDCLPLFKTIDADLQKLDKYNKFDFGSANIAIELKTRRFHKNKYSTTIVGADKIEYIKSNPEKTYYFAFCFTDGLFMIKYEKKLFDTFKKSECYRADRGSSMGVIEIPISFLGKLSA